VFCHRLLKTSDKDGSAGARAQPRTAFASAQSLLRAGPPNSFSPPSYHEPTKWRGLLTRVFPPRPAHPDNPRPLGSPSRHAPRRLRQHRANRSRRDRRGVSGARRGPSRRATTGTLRTSTAMYRDSATGRAPGATRRVRSSPSTSSMTRALRPRPAFGKTGFKAPAYVRRTPPATIQAGTRCRCLQKKTNVQETRSDPALHKIAVLPK
jgi:hypothetical protein